MKNFFVIMALAFLLPACDSAGDGNLSSDAGTVNAAGLPSSTTGVVNGTDVVYVGAITSSSPTMPATGTCRIPDIAMKMPDITAGGKKVSPLPSPMKYFVSTSNILFCTWGVAEGVGTTINLDFSQGPLVGTTCQDLVSDTPDALQRIPFLSYPKVVDTSECCELVRAQQGGISYVETEGVTCGNGTVAQYGSLPISGALCSITGEFMGWACLVS